MFMPSVRTEMLTSLEGKELIVFDDSSWVYNIEDRQWLQLDSPVVNSACCFHSSSKGLICRFENTDLFVSNPLEQGYCNEVVLPKLDPDSTFRHCKSVVLYDVDETGGFKVFAFVEMCDSQGCTRNVCKLYNSWTGEWSRASVPDDRELLGRPLEAVQLQKTVGAASKRIYFPRVVSRGLEDRVEGVMAYHTCRDTWDVVVDYLPLGFVTNRFAGVVHQAMKKRGVDWVIGQPNLLEFEGNLLLIGQVMITYGESIQEFAGIWKLEQNAEQELRSWTELTRVPKAMWAELTSAVAGPGMKEISIVVAEGRVFLTSTSFDTMVMCDLTKLTWERLPKCPAGGQSFYSGCAYRPSLDIAPTKNDNED